jgi:membrane-bound serine protease (ClpP class)
MKRLLLIFVCLAQLLPLHAAEKNISTGSVVVLPVKGAVSEAQFFFLRRALKNAEAVAASAVVLDMDTPGGDLKATEKIVQMFSKSPIPAYTYVNANAGSAGALIALGTKKVFMAPVSAIGAAAPVAGSGQEIPETMNAKIVSYYSGYFRSVAQKNGYHPELVDGFMNLDKEVKIGGEVINPKGALLTLSAQEAVRDIGGKPLLASGIEPDVAALVKTCGLPADRIVRLEPSGFENLAQWITMLAPLFLLGGIMGAYLEFKAPGFGVAGILSAVCFLIFFGGHYIAGLTGLEMVALFVMGLLCILIELIFFPGVFFLALGGALMVLAALFFSMADLYPAQPINFSFDRFQVPMWNLSIAFVASAVGVAFLARFLPNIPVFRSLFLSSSSPAGPSIAPVVTELGAAAKVSVGEMGVALSILRPSGRAQISDGVFDVMTNGEFLEAGTKIQVLAVNGQNIIVGRQVS